MKLTGVLSAAWLLTIVFAALGDVIVDGSSGFAEIRGVSGARCEQTKDSLVFTDIRRDMQIHCRIPGVSPAKVDSFEFRYRCTGSTPQPRAGGELYYAASGGAYSDARRWILPPLIRDGKWHEAKVGIPAIVDSEDWYGASGLVNFRFDPTNAEGGRLEISNFGFHTKNSRSDVARRSGERFGDEDAWPEVVPEFFKTAVSKRRPIRPVEIVSRGGTAVPRRQVAGEKVRLRYDYRGPLPDVESLPVTVLLVSPRGVIKWSESFVIPFASSLFCMGDDVWALEFDYELPRYVGSGEIAVRCESPWLRVVSGRDPEARLDIRRIAVDPDWPTRVVAKVDASGDSPVFSVNGQKIYALWGTVARGHRQDQPLRHSSAPFNFVTVWTDHLEWWPRGDVFDPTSLDNVAEQHRRAYPGAYFIWDISIYPPPDWRSVYPNDIARDEQGKTNLDCGDEEVNFSFASSQALDDLARMVRRVIAYLEQSPYANRIVGYRINSGHTVEWLGWNPSRRDTVLDFSPVAQRGFEKFARQHYPWITDFSVPTLEERSAIDGESILWDQCRHARAIAFHDFYSSAVADSAIRLCRAARAALGNGKLVGTYFGYVMTLNGGGSDQMRAHFSTKRFLDADAVDFVMSPQNYTYASRSPGSQIVDMKPFASIRRHGVVSVIEEDTRTHNMPAARNVQTLTEATTVQILRRNMGVSICRNQPYYTYAITHGTEFDFPQFSDDAAVLAAAGNHAVSVGVRRGAEIAVVVSEDAIKSTPMYVGNAVREIYAGRKMQTYGPDGKVCRNDSVGGVKNATWPYNYLYTEIARIGAGVDYLLAEDLEDNPGDYKFYIFNVCTKLTPSLVKAAERLRERDCTLLWTYAPGFTADEGNSLSNMKVLTGMNFTICQDVSDPGVTLANGMKIGSLEYPKDAFPLKPIFAAENPDKILGRFANGAAGLAEKRTGKSRTIFSGSYFLEAPILKSIAREAGIHLFTEDLDVCEANTRFLSLHARTAGVKTLHLPQKTTVIDVFNRKLVARNVDAFTVETRLHESWLFYYGDDAEELLKKL